MSSGLYLPLDNQLPDLSKPWIWLKFKTFTQLTCALPLFAFFFCIIYSLVFNFKGATSTGCGAVNVLPSISAAIGGYSPQREVWQISIFADFIPRLILIYIATNYNQTDEYNFVYFLGFLNIVENIALLSLSFYDSTHSYRLHEISFVTFVIISEIHMLLLIFHKARRRQTKTANFIIKAYLTTTNILAVAFATFYFIDHTENCDDYTYSKFAFCEYIVVLTNIAFHYTIVYDFPFHTIGLTKTCSIVFMKHYSYQGVMQVMKIKLNKNDREEKLKIFNIKLPFILPESCWGHIFILID